MKKILVTAIIILFRGSVNAQIEMPKELTCTERVFNFSFSLGTKWKISAPEMRPAEVTRDETDYIPAWSLKHNYVTPGTHLLSLFEIPFNAEALGYPINRQNYADLFYHNSFRVIDNPRHLLTGINLSPPIIYKILTPNFPANSISYNQ